MIATIVHVYVKNEHVEDFKKAIHENHRNSVKEIGNHRFDILQDANNPAKFVLYEVYESEEDIAKHRETDHYKKWRDAVASWMDNPRESVKHTLVFPTKETI